MGIGRLSRRQARAMAMTTSRSQFRGVVFDGSVEQACVAVFQFQFQVGLSFLFLFWGCRAHHRRFWQVQRIRRDVAGCRESMMRGGGLDGGWFEWLQRCA